MLLNTYEDVPLAPLPPFFGTLASSSSSGGASTSSSLAEGDAARFLPVTASLAVAFLATLGAVCCWLVADVAVVSEPAVLIELASSET